jgi:phosphoglycolate phosphatase
MPHSLPGSVVFDLDGTLVDTSPDLTASLNHVLRSFGRAEVDPATVRHLVGHGARAMIERGLALEGGSDTALVERGLPMFLAYYADHIADASRPFHGVERALDELADAGTLLTICTNKPVQLAHQLVDALGWTRRFAAVLGGDSLPVRKPDAAHVLATIAQGGGNAASAVFVGDSIVDVGAARAAKVPVVVASFGFTDRPVADLGADAAFDHYDELVPLLRRRPW